MARYEYLPPVWVQEEPLYDGAPENQWELQTPFGMMTISRGYTDSYLLSYNFSERDECRLLGGLEYLKKVGLNLAHSRMEDFLEVIDG